MPPITVWRPSEDVDHLTGEKVDSIKKSMIFCLRVDKSQEVHVMQPRQLARVRPLGKFYGVTKPIVGPKAPAIDCCVVAYFFGAPALNLTSRCIA